MRRAIRTVLLVSYLVPILVCLGPAAGPTRAAARRDADARVRLEPVDVPALLREDAAAAAAHRPGPRRVGRPLEVDIAPDRAGMWEDRADGSRVWRVTVESPGARWLVLGFGTFALPPGAALRVSDPARHRVLGPYGAGDVRAHGQLWTPPLAGDVAVVELSWPAALRGEMPKLYLGTVAHGYRSLKLEGETASPAVPDTTAGAPLAGRCEVDVACPLGAAWQKEKRGVVNLLSGGSGYCSGSLVTTTAADCRNYVLTAHHCLTTPGEAASTVFMFNFERPACGSGTAPTSETISGASLVATYQPTDFTLLELSSTPPPEWAAYYNGWSRDPAPSAQAWAIHHPNNDEKKISHAPNPLTDGTSYGSTHWRASWWSDGHEGVTEPGSSGSPLFDVNHRVVGQLHGGASSCTAGPSAMWDEYGKFGLSWDGGGTADSRLSDWLDPQHAALVAVDGLEGTACLAPGPRLTFVSDRAGDAAGNANGVVEPGERATVAVTLKNAGTLPGTGITGTLSSTTPGVAIARATAAWPDLDLDETAETVAPHFALDLAPGFPCGGTVALHLATRSNENAVGWSADFSLSAGTPQIATVFSDDMEHGANGWLSSSLLGALNWTQSTNRSSSATHSWSIPGSLSRTDTVLLMPTLTSLGAQATLKFKHTFQTQNGYDGAVLEYTTDGGATWADAGKLITAGGYNSSISGLVNSTIKGRACWAGDSLGWRAVTVDLGTLAGHDVQFRFRFATDDRFTSGFGWNVDDVAVTAQTWSCAAAPPGEASPADAGALPLTLARSGSGYALAWGAPSYGPAPATYSLYRVALPASAPLAPHCEAALGPTTSITLSTLTPNSGFLVVARGAAGDGSFGQDSAGGERPRASGADACP